VEKDNTVPEEAQLFGSPVRDNLDGEPHDSSRRLRSSVVWFVRARWYSPAISCTRCGFLAEVGVDLARTSILQRMVGFTKKEVNPAPHRPGFLLVLDCSISSPPGVSAWRWSARTRREPGRVAGRAT
jgi:hypothetical protein